MEDERRPLLERLHSVPTLLPWDPQRAHKSGLFILAAVTLERFAFYAVIMNLFLYLNKGQPEMFVTKSWEPTHALNAVYIILGASYLSAPVGGWLSDSLIDRYWAVIVGKVIYIIGFILLTLLSIDGLSFLGCTSCLTGFFDDQSSCTTHIYVIMVLIGFGVGCLRANIPPFGAEQVRVSGDNAVRQYFNAYYMCINIGSLFGIGVLAYVEQNYANGFLISYITATVALSASLIIFCSGRCYYVVHRTRSSVVKNIFKIIGEGVYNSCKKQESIQGSPVLRRGRHQPQMAVVALTPSWIDRAKVSYGGSFHDATVNDVKQLGTNLAFITVLLPYWLVYFQMSTTFQVQGLHMNVFFNETVDSVGFQIPSAWLTLFDQVFILLSIPLLNLIIYPLLDRKSIHLSPLSRIIIGMIVSLMAVLTAATVEHFRLEEWQQGRSVIQIISNTTYNASALPILWQIPQYCLIGTAEVFAGVAGLEYAHNTSPRAFQGIIMGLYSAVEGLGSILGLGLVQLVRSLHLGWIRNEIFFNEGHLDYFYIFLAIIQVIVIIIFSLVLYSRSEPSLQDSDLEESLGSSALHSEYLNADTTVPNDNII